MGLFSREREIDSKAWRKGRRIFLLHLERKGDGPDEALYSCLLAQSELAAVNTSFSFFFFFPSLFLFNLRKPFFGPFPLTPFPFLSRFCYVLISFSGGCFFGCGCAYFQALKDRRWHTCMSFKIV